MESQRGTALLLGQFAAADSDCKVHIVHRCAIRPLVKMLQSQDIQLKEMAAFAFGRLAQDVNEISSMIHSVTLVLLSLIPSACCRLSSEACKLPCSGCFQLKNLIELQKNVVLVETFSVPVTL